MLRISLVIAAVLTGSAQNAADPGPRLEASLVSDKPVYAPLEPVTLTLTVWNPSSVDVITRGGLELSGVFLVETAGESGRFRPYHTGLSGLVAYPSLTLHPGERHSSQLVMVTNGSGRHHLSDEATAFYPFLNPGKYRIRTSAPEFLLDGRQQLPRLESTIEIAVRPASEAEKDAIAFFGTLEEFAGAVGSADIPFAYEKLPRWAEFANKHPESVYTPAIVRNLARIHARAQ